MKRMIATAAAMVACAGLLTGCPWMLGPRAPFDASGSYEGWYALDTSKDTYDCEFDMDLIQVTELPAPANFVVAGLVEYSYSCLLSDEIPQDRLDAVLDAVATLLGVEELPALTIPVLGEMAQDDSGAIELNMDTEQLGLDPEDFQVNICFDGVGEDTNGDGEMDVFEGTYTLSLAFQTQVPGFEQVDLDVSGPFIVERAK